MDLIRLLSVPYFRRHRLRSVLTLAGIMLGVAVLVGMHTASESVLLALRQTVDRIAGAAEFQVSAGEAGLEEEILERVQAVPEVGAAAPVIESIVATGLRGQGNLLILGVDMTGDGNLRRYDLESGEAALIDDPLVFLAQPDSLMVSQEFAARNGLGLGSRLPLRAVDGEKMFTVRGILRPEGVASAYGGNLAVMDLYAAQKVFGRGRRIDRIDVRSREGFSREQCGESLRRVLGPGVRIEAPSERRRHFESMLRNYRKTVNLVSVFALIVGMFIIQNTFFIAVTERRTEIGTARALGATQSQVGALFLAESALFGLAGSVLGAAAGLLLARGMEGAIGGMLHSLYGVTALAEGSTLSPLVLGGSLTLGILASVLAAYLPARQAARADPVQALQKGAYQLLSSGENRLRDVLAALCAVLAATSRLWAHSTLLFYTGYLLSLVAAVLLVPRLARWMALLLRPVMRRFRPVEGMLAVDSLIQAPRRTSSAVAALMLSLSMVIGLGGLSQANRNNLQEWTFDRLDADLMVTTSEDLTNRDVRFPGSWEAALAAIDGVATVQSVRTARVFFRDSQPLLIATEMDRLRVTGPSQAKRAERERLYRLAAEGRGVILSDNLAVRHQLRAGQILELPFPGGLLPLPILDIAKDYSDSQGAIFVDLSLYRRHWNDTTVNLFRLYLRPGASLEAAKARVLERYPGEGRLFVMDNAAVRRYVLRLSDQWYGMTYLQIAVAVLVAVFGIANTLTVSILDRRRELGVLQAVGALRRQVRVTVWLEAASLALVGVALGLALGVLNVYYWVELNRLDFSGRQLDYQYPVGLALGLLPVILAAALASAIGPAESAVRAPLAAALEYE